MDDSTMHTGTGRRQAAGGGSQPNLSMERSILDTQEKYKKTLKLKSKLETMEGKEARKRMKIIEEEFTAMEQEYEGLLSTYRRGELEYDKQIAILEAKLEKSEKEGSALQERCNILLLSRAKYTANAKTLSSQVSLLARQKASAEGELEKEKRKSEESILQLEVEKMNSAARVKELQKELKKEKTRRKNADKKLADSVPVLVSEEATTSTTVSIGRGFADVVAPAPKKADLGVTTKDVTTVRGSSVSNHKRKHEELFRDQEAEVTPLPIVTMEAKSLRTKQTARKSTGGRAPRRQLAGTRTIVKDPVKLERSEEDDISQLHVLDEQIALARRSKTGSSHPSRGDLPTGKSNSSVTSARTLSKMVGRPENERQIRREQVPKTKKRKVDVLDRDEP